jgi:hypothetical protein
VRVVNVEVDVDTLAGLPAYLSRAFSMRRGLSCDGGAQELHLLVLLRELSLELARLGQLRGDVAASFLRGGRWVRLRILGHVSVTRSVRTVVMFVDDDHKALARGVIAPDA